MIETDRLITSIPASSREEELERAGAYRVYQDPQELLDHLDEVGLRVRVQPG